MDMVAENPIPQGPEAWPLAENVPDTGSEDPVILLSPYDVDTMLLYLGKARDKADRIRENTPAGSYLDKVLQKTIFGIESEMAQLRYLLSCKELPEQPEPARMRPAI